MATAARASPLPLDEVHEHNHHHEVALFGNFTPKGIVKFERNGAKTPEKYFSGVSLPARSSNTARES
ncbi:MAG: hypothetical protein ACREB3_07560 [Burkholderiales bacterium]